MRTDRKKYKQPSMRVVKLRQRAKMLAGSPKAGMEDYKRNELVEE